METTYPPTISGSAEDKATGATIPLVARRTGVLEHGCEVYDVAIPMPGLWMQIGRVALNFDFMPGRSLFRLRFTERTH